MIEFVSGAIFGAALAVTLTFVILLPFISNDDDDGGKDEWDPWGGRGRHGR